MALICSGLLRTHNDVWESATRHPFLENCKSGAIESGQFNTWLVQDYHFVTEFTRMVANVLANAPVSHFNTILGGLAALQDELNWFREKAQERDLDLNVAKQEANKHYCEFMASLSSEPYAVQATVFWAIEVVYNQAWQLPGPMVKPYDEFADRWGNQDFTAYVTLLEKQADEALKNSSEEVQKKAEEVFLSNVRLGFCMY